MGKNLPIVGIGYKAGKRTVMHTTHERKAGYMVWGCRCECGNEVLLDTRCLQRKTVLDCGCSTKVKPGQNDLTGKRESGLRKLPSRRKHTILAAMTR